MFTIREAFCCKIIEVSNDCILVDGFIRISININFITLSSYMMIFCSPSVDSRLWINDICIFSSFHPKELVLDDEWNKAVGRIPPMVANLFVRFRVNTLVNYEVVDRAFAAFEEDLRGTPDYAAWAVIFGGAFGEAFDFLGSDSTEQMWSSVLFFLERIF